MLNCVELKQAQGIAWLTMNQPASYNSLSAELCQDMLAAMRQIEADSAVRVVVLSGAGRGFCAGGDLKAIGGFSSVDEAHDYVHLVGSVVEFIRGSAKPYIAMINGATAGAGFNLMLACDYVIAQDKAKFTQAFNGVGLVSDCGGNYLLPRLVGPLRAKELIMLPRTIDTDRAYQLGLVNQVVPVEQLLDATAEVAAELASRSAAATAAAKRLLNSSFDMSWGELIQLEEQTQAELMRGEDCAEGIRAYFEKREPKFK